MTKPSFLFLLGLLLLVLLPQSLLAQEIPEEIQRELQAQGMTLEEARLRAQQLGINLNNPRQATQRARELGIPEAQIRAMLRAVEAARQASLTTADSTQLPTVTGVSVAPLDTLVRADSAAPALRPPSPFFGYTTFFNRPEAFDPFQAGPVDEAYVVGPGDELRLLVWGSAEFQYDLTVDNEGRIFVPNVGQITVAGQRLGRLRDYMRNILSRSYSGLTATPPTAFIDVSVTRIRPVQVFVLGEVANPGGYTISSAATVFNALYAIGGPLETGTLREIQIIREGRVIDEVDIYDYLLRGYETTPTRLQSGDYLFIGPRRSTITIAGAVRRPSIYELKADEDLSTAISFAGGLLPDAAPQQVQIERITPFTARTDGPVAREVVNVDLGEVLLGATVVPIYDGDEIRVPSILDVARNSIQVTGAVLQPGLYQISDSVQTIQQVLMEAGGLGSDAYQERATLIRLKSDPNVRPPSVQVRPFVTGRDTSDTIAPLEEILSINLTLALQDNPLHNLPLRAGDRLQVFSRLDLEERRTVRISGQVRTPGTYTLRDNMTLYDLLYTAGGLADSLYLESVFLKRADVLRRVDDQQEEIMPFHLGDALQGAGMASMLLQPNDEIRIYAAELTNVTDPFVTIEGAIRAPGRFRFQQNMSLEDLIVQAGGFTEQAFLGYAEVTRADADAENWRKAITMQIPLDRDLRPGTVSFSLTDTTNVLHAARQFQLQHRDRVYIRIDPDFELQQSVLITGEVRFPGQYTLVRENETLREVLNRAGGILPSGYPRGGRLFRDNEQVIVEIDKVMRGEDQANVILQPGDEIVIPLQPNTVAVRGNVANEGLIKFRPGRRLSYYLDQAGGKGERTEAVFLTQPTGATYKIGRNFLFFRENPKVQDGAVIQVVPKPEEENRARIDWGEVLAATATLTTQTLTVILLIRQM